MNEELVGIVDEKETCLGEQKNLNVKLSDQLNETKTKDDEIEDLKKDLEKSKSQISSLTKDLHDSDQMKFDLVKDIEKLRSKLKQAPTQYAEKLTTIEDELQ